MLDDWDDLDLLRHPGHTRETNSERQRTRLLFDDIAALSLVRSTRTLWRGLSHASYSLSPSAVRTAPRLTSAAAVATYAETLMSEVRRARHSWREGVGLRGLTPLEDLSLLQHFGTPTPLLDLTADPLVALYFAVRAHDREDGLLVGWNAVAWPDFTPVGEKALNMRWLTGGGGKSSISLPKDSGYSAIVEVLDRGGTLGWFVPPVVTDRVVVQRSRMLVAPVVPSTRSAWFSAISDLRLPELPQGWNADQLEALFARQGQGRRAMPPVVGFRINQGLKEYIRSILSDSFGIDHTTMFPDPSGYATERR